jgi:hypothetical protein
MDKEKTLEMLSKIYNCWLVDNGLPPISADELLFSMAQQLTSQQRQYLNAFINYWNQIELT